jgi:hypothetical protein
MCTATISLSPENPWNTRMASRSFTTTRSHSTHCALTSDTQFPFTGPSRETLTSTVSRDLTGGGVLGLGQGDPEHRATNP